MDRKAILREPLVHFLAAGVVLFAIFDLAHEPEKESLSSQTIVVDKPGLLTFLQYRSKAFETEYFTHELETMPAQEREELINQYVEEEMLYREAKKLALEQGDYVIRQRLVQKMRFLIDELTEGGEKPSDAALTDYLNKHKDIYRLEPSVTFTHVFVDSSLRSDTEARAMAEKLKGDLNARGAAFNDAPQFGDRFPFMQNYVERTHEFVASHFGAEFAAAVAKLAPSEKRWAGPVKSQHGYHLILLTSRSEARMPNLDEIRTQIAEDWERDRTQTARSAGLNRLASEYKIERKDLDTKEKTETAK